MTLAGSVAAELRAQAAAEQRADELTPAAGANLAAAAEMWTSHVDQSTMDVRTMTGAEVGLLYSWLRSDEKSDPQQPKWWSKKRYEIQRAHERARGTLLGAFVPGVAEPIAFVLLKRLPSDGLDLHPDAPIVAGGESILATMPVEIDALGVPASLRGRGIGAAVVNRIMDAAGRLGRGVEAEVLPTAVAFWLAQGFVPKFQCQELGDMVAGKHKGALSIAVTLLYEPSTARG
eukprot:gnl/TRDRNA2_/TRDRNA2_186669_c0_seq1.p1 gnl/TRDRNA2_/TRDRNA2_186669_c0~~gnl/TRDRNA2_/TRDRNA2_186669_c0_seq1.p1  ORF type:complete len:232 (-),score=48.37 gnl/TRDRNA2_/TRDRNA2_186669_c0_seq1:158-853(-)